MMSSAKKINEIKQRKPITHSRKPLNARPISTPISKPKPISKTPMMAPNMTMPANQTSIPTKQIINSQPIKTFTPNLENPDKKYYQLVRVEGNKRLPIKNKSFLARHFGKIGAGIVSAGLIATGVLQAFFNIPIFTQTTFDTAVSTLTTLTTWASGPFIAGTIGVGVLALYGLARLGLRLYTNSKLSNAMDQINQYGPKIFTKAKQDEVFNEIKRFGNKRSDKNLIVKFLNNPRSIQNPTEIDKLGDLLGQDYVLALRVNPKEPNIRGAQQKLKEIMNYEF